jgi:hypothetical protein
MVGKFAIAPLPTVNASTIEFAHPTERYPRPSVLNLAFCSLPSDA